MGCCDHIGVHPRCGPCAAESMGRIVWADDLEDLKRRVDVDVQALDADVARCPQLNPNTRTAWGQFVATWTKYRDEPTPLFGRGGRYDDGLLLEARLAQWQAQIAKECAVSVPTIKPQLEQEQAQTDTLVSAAKWLAAAVVVGAAVYGFRAVVR